MNQLTEKVFLLPIYASELYVGTNTWNRETRRLHRCVCTAVTAKGA